MVVDIGTARSRDDQSPHRRGGVWGLVKRRPVSHGLIILQLVGVAVSCFPVGLRNAGPKTALVLIAMGIGLGVYTLSHNRIGNFSIYPEIKVDAKFITTGPYRWIRHPHVQCTHHHDVGYRSV